MSVPLSDLLIAHSPSDRIGTPEVLVDPDLPQVPPGQRDEALATARDVATDVLYAHGALPSQSLTSLFARDDGWGRFFRVLYAPHLLTLRVAVVAGLIVAAGVVIGADPLQITALAAVGIAVAVTIDTWGQSRVQDADDAAIEDAARLLLSQAGLHEILPTNGNADRA